MPEVKYLSKEQRVIVLASGSIVGDEDILYRE